MRAASKNSAPGKSGHGFIAAAARDFTQMTTLAKPVREMLAAHYTVDRPSVSEHQKSQDGTQKWLLKMADGQEVESVHIPESDRGALCVSSQVGCTLTCRFCHTGTQRLVRNLEPSEIVSQVMLARDYLNEWAGTEERRHRQKKEAVEDAKKKKLPRVR